MPIRKPILACLIFFLGSLLWGGSPSDEALKLRVRVLEIPRLQSVVWGQPDGQGNIIGGQYGGDVTDTFPDGLTILFPRLDEQALGEQIKEAIRSGIEFGCAAKFPRGIGINLMDEYDLTVDDRALGAIVEPHLLRRDPVRKLEYWFELRPLAPMGEGVYLSIQFYVQPSPDGKTDPPRRVQVSEVLGLSFSQPILVGFPSKDEGPRGTVYFVALYASRK